MSIVANAGEEKPWWEDKEWDSYATPLDGAITSHMCTHLATAYNQNVFFREMVRGFSIDPDPPIAAEVVLSAIGHADTMHVNN